MTGLRERREKSPVEYDALIVRRRRLISSGKTILESRKEFLPTLL